MAIKRKVLSFSEFKKSKKSLENPKKLPIKESVSEEEKTDVLFLKDKDDDTVFAFFPNEISDSKGNLTCYAHVGQHSACSQEYADECEKATSDEYKGLEKELIDRGYNLNVLNDQDDHANESLSEKEMKEMESETLVKGHIYKVFDKKNNGSLVYSAAEYENTDEGKGNKFKLVNKPTEQFIWIKLDDMKDYVFTPSSFKPKN